MKKLLLFFSKNKKLSILTLLSLMVQVLGTLAVPFLIGELIDSGIAANNYPLVIKIGKQMFGVAVIGSAAAIYGSYLSARLAALYGYQLRRDFYHKVQALSIQEIESFNVSSLLTRMMNDVTNIQRSMVMMLQLIIPAPIICLFAVGMTAITSPKLAIIPLLSIVLYLASVSYLLKKGLPLSINIQTRLDKMMVKLREFFNGVMMIRAFDNQNEEEKQLNQRFADYADSMIRVNKIFAFLTPVAYLLMGLVFALIIWFGGILVGNGQLQIGVVTAVIEYSVLTLAYLIMAAMVIVTLPRAIASLHRVNEVLEKTPAKSEVLTNTPNIKDEAVFARFQHVTFAYNGAEPVLNDISFDILKGKTTAIVGGIGSGKSTIAKVLLNLATIQQGQILVDGVDLKQTSQTSLIQKISYVPQKAFLFSGTIESNLKMGCPTATADRMQRALAIAQATDFVATQDNGIHSFVAQGGTNFSGGQKQRISIARALVKPAQLYIFDDSFSALDYQTDALLRQALATEMSDATFLIVAQRLSTIKDADQIIVLDEGRIVGRGTHQELLKTNQTYQEFAISQGVSLKGGN